MRLLCIPLRAFLRKPKSFCLAILFIFSISLISIVLTELYGKIPTIEETRSFLFFQPFRDSVPSVRKLKEAASLSFNVSLMKVQDVDCQALFLEQSNEVWKAKDLLKSRRAPYSNEYYVDVTKDCTQFKSSRGYILSSLTQEEQDFPIAYSILVFKEVEMVERLLRAIYRPQNFYCIHVDVKSSENFTRAIENIADCFPNVFTASTRVNVTWSQFSVLWPEIVCMQDLWSRKAWKYFINLTGQEFPLRTNYELVKIFKAFNGANAVHGTIINANNYRWRNVPPPPHSIRPVKGTVHVAVNRDFVDYILHNQTAQDFLEWTKDTDYPDETFFASLNHNPQLGIKGSYLRDPDYIPDGEGKPFLTRHKIWYDRRMCGSDRFTRGICILSIFDLRRLGRSRYMFANKFYLKDDPVVIECLEERIFNNTRDEYLGNKTFDTTFYAKQDFVVNQVE